jgi:hypothetical protein
MSIDGGLVTSFTIYLMLDALTVFVEGSFWMHLAASSGKLASAKH